MAARNPTLLRHILRLPAEIIVGFFILIDSIVSPLFRPLMRWLSSLRLVHRLEQVVASLDPYVILVLLVVPFGFAELAKVYGVFLMSEGHFRTGMTIFIGAYVVSILVCERTFHAGKSQLMTIPWFARAYNWLMTIKDHVVGWFRQTYVGKLAGDLRQNIRIALRRTRVRIRATLGLKQKGVLERP